MANNRSNYDGLQVTLNSRNFHGLSMVAGYTYSHSLDDVGRNWDFGYGRDCRKTLITRRRIREQRFEMCGIASHFHSPMPSPARRATGKT